MCYFLAENHEFIWFFLMLLRWSFEPPDMGQNVSRMGRLIRPQSPLLWCTNPPVRSTCDFWSWKDLIQMIFVKKYVERITTECSLDVVLWKSWDATLRLDSGVMKWAMGFHKESLELFEEAIAREFWVPEIIWKPRKKHETHGTSKWRKEI